MTKPVKKTKPTKKKAKSYQNIFSKEKTLVVMNGILGIVVIAFGAIILQFYTTNSSVLGYSATVTEEIMSENSVREYLKSVFAESPTNVSKIERIEELRSVDAELYKNTENGDFLVEYDGFKLTFSNTSKKIIDISIYNQ